MSPTKRAPSSPHSKHGQRESDHLSSPQRVTETVEEQNQGAHSSNNIATAMSSLNVADNIAPLGSSTDKQAISPPFGPDLRKFQSAALTEDTIIHIPGRGEVIAGSTDSHWVSSSSATSRDPAKHAKIGQPVPGDVTEALSKRQKESADTPRKRMKANGRLIENTQDVESDDVHMNLAKNKQGDNNFVDNGDMPYRSYRCINLPERSNPETPPVEGDPSTYYGTMDYIDSSITYWCDQKGLSYTKAEKFAEGGYSHECLRQRHVSALAIQFEKYGLKEDDEIPEPKSRVRNRGKKRGGKKSGSKVIAANNVPPTDDGPPTSLEDLVQITLGSIETTAKENLPIYVREAPFRQLEMTAIVVCKDLFNMEFSDIQKLMDKSYNFSMSVKEAESYYHAARPSAYGSKYHGYSSVDDHLDPDLLKEKNEMVAAAEALMALSGHGMDDAESKQVSHQQRPPVKISQSKKNGQTRVMVKPVAERAMTSTVSSAELEAAETLLQFSKQAVVFGNAAPSGKSNGRKVPATTIQAPDNRVVGRAEKTSKDTKSGNGIVLTTGNKDADHMIVDSD